VDNDGGIGQSSLVSRWRQRVAIAQLALLGVVNLGFAVWALSAHRWLFAVTLCILAPCCVPLIAQVRRRGGLAGSSAGAGRDEAPAEVAIQSRNAAMIGQPPTGAEGEHVVGRASSEWKGMSGGALVVTLLSIANISRGEKVWSMILVAGAVTLSFLAGYLFRADLVRKGKTPKLQMFVVEGDKVDRGEDTSEAS
jgi:hypothetical protein